MIMLSINMEILKRRTIWRVGIDSFEKVKVNFVLVVEIF